jgi:hypothetical protein
MKSDHKLLVPLLLFALSAMNCTGQIPVIDLNDPATFPGTYKIASFTDLTGENFGQAGVTFKTDEPTTITLQEGETTVSMTMTLTGTLTLTETRYAFSQTMKMSFLGLAEETATDTDAGTYTIEGGTITIVSDDETEDPETGSISVNGAEMTLEFADMKIVLKKA